MSTTYQCYPQINILNPDGSINCNNDGIGRDLLDFTLFDYIDLTPFGGDQFTEVSSSDEIIAAFLALNLEVEIQECKIVLLSTIEAQNIVSYKDNFFYLTLDNVIMDNIDYNLFNIVDTSYYSQTTPNIFVYSNIQLKAKLELIFNKTIDIVGNKIYVRKYLPTLYNMAVSANPTIQLIYNNSPITNNYSIIQSIDLSYYGGDSIILVTSDLDVRAAFLALGISVLISGSTITLLEYTSPVANISVCTFSYIDIIGVNNYCIDNSLEFSVIFELDFTPFGGLPTQVNGNSSIVNTFALLGYQVVIQNCRIKVLNMACQTIITEIQARSVSIPLAVDDTIPDCIVPYVPYAFNPIANDTDSSNQMLTIIKINGLPIILGQTLVIANGVTIKSIESCNLELTATAEALTAQNNFTYTVKNMDGVTSTATVNYCVDNTINPTTDYLEFVCDSSAAIDVSTNDLGTGPLTVTHLNNIPIEIGEVIDIIANSLTARLLVDGVTVELQSLNMYHGMGAITYTITNGGTTTNGTLNYNISDDCDVCLDFNMQFTVNNCSGVCWGDLTYNNNIVDNYLVKLKKGDGSFYVLPSGLEFKIGKGIYAGGTFPPNTCIPMPTGVYSIYVEFSDIGDAIDCFNNTVNVVPVPCGITCNPSYNGLGGISAQLSYDLEVSSSSILNISNIYTGNVVPDGIVVYYNGNAIYHTGNSVECPYTTPGSPTQEYLNCIGCSYQSNVPAPNASIPIPYVSGINYVTVVVFGYPCDTAITAWSFTTNVICG